MDKRFRKIKDRTKKRQWLAGMLTLFVLLMVWSCSESDCSLNGQSSIRFVFVNSRNGAVVSLFDSLTVTALSTDSVLLNRERGINHITLPLNYTGETTTFVLHYTRFLRDTLRITHENYPHFISLDCGISMYYQLKDISYTTMLIDSVRLINPEIDDNEKDNYRIYYTPDE